MAITYYKLWDRLNRTGKKKKDLREFLSPTTIAKITKNETITTETLDKLCAYLNCDVGDICEYEPNKEAQNEG